MRNLFRVAFIDPYIKPSVYEGKVVYIVAIDYADAVKFVDDNFRNPEVLSIHKINNSNGDTVFITSKVINDKTQ